MLNRHLATVFVGKSKEDCTLELHHNLTVDVNHCFGQYVKFYVALGNKMDDGNDPPALTSNSEF